MSIDVSRRQFMTATAASALGAMLAPSFGAFAEPAPIVLTAGRRTLDVEGRSAAIFAITQPDGASGIFTRNGARFRVRLRNEAGNDTLVHWHGLKPPSAQDGVPGISAPALAPGATADYDFPLDFGGTYWMHSHEGLQEQSLMSAPLIIRERQAPDRQEVVLMLHDFSFRSPVEIFTDLRRSAARPRPGRIAMNNMSDTNGMDAMRGMSAGAPMKMDLNDVDYDAFLANDRTLMDPQVLRVERRGRILLRIINAAAASNFFIDLEPVTAELVAVDGHGVEPQKGSRFPLAMAQRIDLAFEIPADLPVVPVLAQLEGERRRTGIVLAAGGGAIRKIADLAAAPEAALDLRTEQNLRAAAPLIVKPADRVHEVRLTGSMEGYTWGLNGRAYGNDEPLMVRQGERVEIVMTNTTMMAHAMHLHGHFFQVVAIDGRRFEGAVRDTVLVPPRQSVTIAFDADNPGTWAFHCHNLYHMHAGMMTTMGYVT